MAKQLSPEHIAAMIEGRKKAKERKELERIAAQGKDATAMPAGHERDEQIRKNAEALEAQKEIRHEDIGVEPIDPSKLNAPISNEAMRFAIEQRKKRFSNQHPVQNAQPGWIYCRMKLPGTCSTEDAKVQVRQAMQQAKLQGWVPVQGNDPEDKKYEGNDCASGTPLRGYMDTVLMKMRIEDKILMDEEAARKRARQGIIEEQTILLAQQRGIGNTYRGGVVGDDPELAKRFSPDQRSTVVMRTTFTEGDLRRGSIPGMAVGPGRR